MEAQQNRLGLAQGFFVVAPAALGVLTLVTGLQGADAGRLLTGVGFILMGLSSYWYPLPLNLPVKELLRTPPQQRPGPRWKGWVGPLSFWFIVAGLLFRIF